MFSTMRIVRQKPYLHRVEDNEVLLLEGRENEGEQHGIGSTCETEASRKPVFLSAQEVLLAWAE